MLLIYEMVPFKNHFDKSCMSLCVALLLFCCISAQRVCVRACACVRVCVIIHVKRQQGLQSHSSDAPGWKSVVRPVAA